MGAISELLDIVGLAKKANKELKANPNDIKAVSSLFTKAKSIASQASKYVMEYPVAVSSRITDYKTAIAITKQVEFDCARFIILASGLDPVIKLGSGDTIEAHMNQLVSSYESYSGFKVSLKPASEDTINDAKLYLNECSKEEYQIFNTNTETTRSDFSSEEVKKVDIVDGDDGEFIDLDHVKTNPNSKDEYLGKARNFLKDVKYINTSDTPIEDIIGIRPDDLEPEKQAEWDKAKDMLEKSKTLSNIKYNHAKRNDFAKLGSLGPTVINIDLIIVDGNGMERSFILPLAIKATLQFVDEIDINSMLKQVNTPGKKFLDFIKLTTGQTNFFKDFLFALDSAKSDVERERTIGNTPFFRRLMNNKSKYRLKTVSQFIPILKNVVAKKQQKDLPMCTMVIDESELRALNIRLNDALNNRGKYIDTIIDTYMLLGFAIVDKDNEVIHFFYSGESNPITVNIEEIGNRQNSSVNSNIAKALAKQAEAISKIIKY